MNAIQSGESTGTTEITPSGIAVYYQSQPKRLYRLRDACYGHNDIHDLAWLAASATREATENCGGWPEEGWREIPSVTTVLGVLEKKALPWWGMKVGVDGVRSLIDLGVIENPTRYTVDDLIDLLTIHKLTVNHVRDKAGNRGQAVHDAFEAWARTGLRPDASIFPEEERGYVEGLLAFLDDVPSIEPLACEVLVASVEHGFAGRYDIRFRTSEPHDVVVHRTPKKGPQYRRLAPGIFLGDLKTSRGAYPSHALQAEAYEAASIESGYEPTDARGILLVGADGTYQLKRVKACIDDFLAVLEVWRRMENAKEWL